MWEVGGILRALETTVVRARGGVHRGWMAGVKGGARSERRQQGKPWWPYWGVWTTLLRIALLQSHGGVWWPVGQILPRDRLRLALQVLF